MPTPTTGLADYNSRRHLKRFGFLHAGWLAPHTVPKNTKHHRHVNFCALWAPNEALALEPLDAGTGGDDELGVM